MPKGKITVQPPGSGMPGMPGMGSSPEEIAQAMKLVGRPTGQKMTPEQERYMGLLRRITDASVTMVIKVASAGSECKPECPVYKQAVEIAKIIDELQGVASTQGIVVRKSGKNRR